MWTWCIINGEHCHLCGQITHIPWTKCLKFSLCRLHKCLIFITVPVICLCDRSIKSEGRIAKMHFSRNLPYHLVVCQGMTTGQSRFSNFAHRHHQKYYVHAKYHAENHIFYKDMTDIILNAWVMKYSILLSSSVYGQTEINGIVLPINMLSDVLILGDIVNLDHKMARNLAIY